MLRAEIGRGAFAIVYLAKCIPLDEDVAIKILDIDELDTSWEEVRVGVLSYLDIDLDAFVFRKRLLR